MDRIDFQMALGGFVANALVEVQVALTEDLTTDMVIPEQYSGGSCRLRITA